MRACGDEMFSRLSCPRDPSHRRSRKPSADSGTEGRDQLTRSLSGPSTCQLSSHGCSKGSAARGQEESEPSSGYLGLNANNPQWAGLGQIPLGKAGVFGGGPRQTLGMAGNPDPSTGSDP